MWAETSVFYQIYPLGFCGAPAENDGVPVPRIKKVKSWIPHLRQLHVDAIYFSPVFESDRHGYDTRDYRKIDTRLGTNEDFSDVCASLKENGIRIVLDGVFNHVGRGFWAFQDILKNRGDSRYQDWFHIDFSRNSIFNDGFYYEGWEGHYNLVKLNLKNPEVVNYLLESVRFWAETFGIDGLRLDVAYLLDEDFLKRLRAFCDSLKPDFLLIGEIISGDYRRIMNGAMLHSCTNYECYKGLYSSFNDLNLFEIDYSLNRLFGRNEAALYKGSHLLNFADNHDVTRVASILKDKRHLPLLYGLLFAMPGIPCLYYGSEWGTSGVKENGNDRPLRPYFDAPQWNGLTDLISRLALIHRQSKALVYGDYKNLALTNRRLLFEREFNGERIRIAINADDREFRLNFDDSGGFETVADLLSGETVRLRDGYALPPLSFRYWRVGKS